MDPMMADVVRMALENTLASVGFPELHAPFRDAVHGVHAFGLDGAVAAVLALVEIAVTKYVDIPAILTRVCDACPDIGSGTLDIMYIVSNVVRDIYHIYSDFVCEVRKHGGRGVVEAIIGEHIARRAAMSSHQSCRDIVDAHTIRLVADTAAEAIRDNSDRLSAPSVPPHWPDYDEEKAACFVDANWGTARAAVDLPAAVAKMQSYANGCMPQLGTFTFEFAPDGERSVGYQVVAAGGCPTAALSFPARGCGDIDVYVVCDHPDKDVIDALLVHVVKQFEDRLAEAGDGWMIRTVMMTVQATTFNMMRSTHYTDNVSSNVQYSQVQFSMRVHPSVASVLLSFDMSCVCVAYDGTSFILTPLALWSHIHRHVIVNPLIPSTPMRCCIKYPCRGFNVVVPVSAKTMSDITSRISSISSTSSIPSTSRTSSTSSTSSTSRTSKLWRRTKTGAWNIAVFVCWKQLERVGGSAAQAREAGIRLEELEDEWGSDVMQIMDDVDNRVPGDTLFRTSGARGFVGGSKEHHLDMITDDILSGNDASVRASWSASASGFYSALP
jgi:hypothetical protein